MTFPFHFYIFFQPFMSLLFFSILYILPDDFVGLVKDCGNSSGLEMELLQSSVNPAKFFALIKKKILTDNYVLIIDN